MQVADGAVFYFPVIENRSHPLTFVQIGASGAGGPQMAVVTCGVCGAKATLIVERDPKITYGADFRTKCREIGNATAEDASECEAMRLAVKRTLARQKHTIR